MPSMCLDPALRTSLQHELAKSDGVLVCSARESESLHRANESTSAAKHGRLLLVVSDHLPGSHAEECMTRLRILVMDVYRDHG